MSAISRRMHSHSPPSDITKRPPPLTAHQTRLRGKPDTIHTNRRWKAYAVDEKSRHFFARSTCADASGRAAVRPGNLNERKQA
eukprot:357950-Chlamydomonas_euryale.AAC.1